MSVRPQLVVSITESVITVTLIPFTGNKTIEREQVEELVSTVALQDVILAPGFETVGPSAFMECPELKTIELPATLKRIGERAFYGCGNLTSVKVHGDTELGGEGVHLPNALEAIEDEAFRLCRKMKAERLILPEGLKTIGTKAFEDCRFEKLYFPGSLTSVGLYAFDWWTANTEIYVQDEVKCFEDIVWSFAYRAKPSRPILISNISSASIVDDFSNAVRALDETLIRNDGDAFAGLIPDYGTEYLFRGQSADAYVTSLYHDRDENNLSIASCGDNTKVYEERVLWCGDLSHFEAIRKHLEDSLGMSLGSRNVYCVFNVSRFSGRENGLLVPGLYLFYPEEPRKILPIRHEDFVVINEIIQDRTPIGELYVLCELIDDRLLEW